MRWSSACRGAALVLCVAACPEPYKQDPVDSDPLPDIPPVVPDPDDTGLDGPLPIERVAVGVLVVTEIHSRPVSCPDDTAQYIEIHNTGTAPVDLDGLVVSDGEHEVQVSGTTVVEGAGFVAVSVGGAGAFCYAAGFTPAATYDPLSVFDPGEVVRIGHGDPLEVLDEVPIGAFPVEDGVAWALSSGSYDVDANDAITAWCGSIDPLVPDDLLIVELGSPGVANGACSGDPGPLLGVGVGPGALVVTEVMADPEADGECSDARGEYFEVLNAAGRAVDLAGVTISVNGETSTVQSSVVVAADTLFLAEFAGAGGATPADCYPEVTGELLWDQALMHNVGTVLSLSNPRGLIDELDFTGWSVAPGVALNLSSDHQDAAENDDRLNWCSAASLIPGGFNDRGTPGTPNDRCLDDAPDPSWAGPDPVVFADALGAGDLIVTEMMVDPSDCNQGFAEYIEVYNASGHPVELFGLRIEKSGGVESVSGSYLIPPDSHALGLYFFANTIADCYGLTFDFLHAGLPMANGGDTLRLSNDAGVIDEVVFDSWTVPDGAALSLDPAERDAVSNDDPASWCPSPDLIPGAVSDRGSPGEPNPSCPI